jgi:hypothetical protein
MKSFLAKDLVWGVEEIPGEENVLKVQSKSEAGVKHRVELEALAGFGQCSCPGFMQYGKMSKVEAALVSGKWPRDDFQCEHLRRAWKYYKLKNIQRDIEARAKATTRERFGGNVKHDMAREICADEAF